MNYNLALDRAKDVADAIKCIHGIDGIICGFCQGITDKKRTSKSSTYMDSETLEKYEALKAKFKNFREIWSEDEFFVVYANLKDVRGTKLELSAIYRTSFELERTLGAIRWAMEHIFSKKEYHRGKTVQEFRKLFGLE
jgi:hypothetical protein